MFIMLKSIESVVSLCARFNIAIRKYETQKTKMSRVKDTKNVGNKNAEKSVENNRRKKRKKIAKYKSKIQNRNKNSQIWWLIFFYTN